LETRRRRYVQLDQKVIKGSYSGRKRLARLAGQSAIHEPKLSLRTLKRVCEEKKRFEQIHKMDGHRSLFLHSFIRPQWPQTGKIATRLGTCEDRGAGF
jgi:hypothetical protein